VLTIVRSASFKRDVERARRRGKDLDKLRGVLATLIAGKPVPQSYRDHPLKGD